ncbi:pyroglutamyl-peptidase [Ancylobacter sp. 3268]|uniref:pyroglutamyl-peptidase I family protein n=1 Tax=Ancylobacter sp. 3268 TaxID=2817752 RepID=UPI00285F3F6A|nr:peptidase C15 [Ancylobacter sp. 3268]MDR6952761.1 pyroglutamyl-peptidase [Ancylobacter sp. 3268]
MTPAGAPHILITGFGPFPGAPANPAASLARDLARLRRPALAGTRRSLRILPTLWEQAAGFPSTLDAFAPDIVLMIGLAARRRAVSIEWLGRNHTRLLPDAARRHPSERRFEAGSAAIRRGGFDAAPLLQALAVAGLPARLSRDAGGYVCNALAWSAYGWARQGGARRLAVFVHIPRPRAGGRLDRGRMLRGLGNLMVALVAQHRLRVAVAR